MSTLNNSDVMRLCADSNTAIFIVTKGTILCDSLLRLLKEPDRMGDLARQRFDLGWQLYEERYAGAGGVFGILIHADLKNQPTIIAAGLATQAAEITKFLSVRARQIMRGEFTPIKYDLAFEEAVNIAVAGLSPSEGNA
jgi:hypothetical protein